jgi:hypothetical protein
MSRHRSRGFLIVTDKAKSLGTWHKSATADHNRSNFALLHKSIKCGSTEADTLEKIIDAVSKWFVLHGSNPNQLTTI